MLTSEQIKLANQKGTVIDSPDGRINDENVPLTNKELAVKPSQTKSPDKVIISMEQLPTEDEKINEEVTEQVEEATKKINFNDFLDAAAIDKTPLVDKTTEKKKSVATKLETGLEEKSVENEPVIKEEEEKKQEVGVKTPTKTFKDKQGLQPRDVTGIPVELTEHFKNEMSRPAYEKIKPLIIERQQLLDSKKELEEKINKLKEGGPPDSYYEHPAGFILTPDYANGLQTVNQAQQFVNHWEGQFQKVKSGSATYNTLNYD